MEPLQSSKAGAVSTSFDPPRVECVIICLELRAFPNIYGGGGGGGGLVAKSHV